MAGGKFLINLGTSFVFGSLKYGYKLIAEPENRVRNTVFLASSMVGLGLLGDVVEAASESGSDFVDSIDTNSTGYESFSPSSTQPQNVSMLALALKHRAAEVKIETINDHLLDNIHPETEIPFVENTVETSTDIIIGVFPSFESLYDIQLPKAQHLASDDVQFKIANRMLYADIICESSIAEDLELSQVEIENLIRGITPEGYTWHHNEEPGVLQLVNEEIHSNTAHTGGREIWGGGESFR
ncbi:HNH endonuclease [Bacillaceae bacterium CLA-AA-H227]|uniref:HNH endonuclease n=1 Tax=Robertmurraya yapensis (ex Hitch et al 2024) TaxID=3133160 RepID=A0ACC6S6L7_9BACI